jgi:hypothetical protein
MVETGKVKVTSKGHPLILKLSIYVFLISLLFFVTSGCTRIETGVVGIREKCYL